MFALTRDEIARHLKNQELRGFKDVLDELAYTTMSTAQQFDFGCLEPSILDTALESSKPIVEAGLLTFPFQEFSYRVDLTFSGRTGVGVHVHVTHSTHSAERGYVVVGAVRVAGANLEGVDGYIGAGVWMSEDLRFYSAPPGQVKLVGKEECERACQSLVRYVIGLTTILQTKGVPQAGRPPPAKVNAKRAKAGRPLVPYVTVVNAAAYAAGAINSTPGTHASPVPHLRRGHVRHIRDWSGNKRPVQVRDHLVNWTGATPPPLQRQNYVVK